MKQEIKIIIRPRVWEKKIVSWSVSIEGFGLGFQYGLSFESKEEAEVFVDSIQFMRIVEKPDLK